MKSANTSKNPVFTRDLLRINIAPIVTTALLLNPDRASSILITPKRSKIAVPANAVTSNAKTSNTKKVISIENTIRSTIKFISLPNITCEVIKNVTKDKIKMGIY
tara:strand:- start:436 stop:750 length:315 start_codon:yes stop_codon:yes gene_type:complete